MKEKGSADKYSPRSLAFRVLRQVEKGEFAQELLDKSLSTCKLNPKDRRLLTQLVYGTIRYQGSLDFLIPSMVSLTNRIILRLSAYQLFYLTRVPVYAVVNESVELAKRFSTTKSAKFINAILRKWCRTKLEIVFPDPDKDFPRYLSIKHSHPLWLVGRWIELFGRDQTAKLCRFNNQIPPLIARVNTLKTTTGVLIKELQKDGVDVKETVHPLALEINSAIPLTELTSFRQGLFQVQDISSMYIAELLDVKPGMQVLDLCASPGGKTCYIAQLMVNKGEIVAVDISQKKIDLIEKNCTRLGINIVRTLVADGRKVTQKQFNTKFDRILVDVPCSNTGVFRRRIEARWRLKQSDFKRLASLQLELLNNAIRLLKSAGFLVYSTCSIDPVENEGVVEKFLNRPGIKLVDKISKVPHQDNTDGIYAAKFALY